MSEDLRYHLEPGTRLILQGREQIVTGTGANGYKLWDHEEGQDSFSPFSTFVQHLKQSGLRISPPTSDHSSSLRLRGLSGVEACSEEQQTVAKFNLAVCRAAAALQEKERLERSKPFFHLSERKLNAPAAQSFIADMASKLFGQKIHTHNARGGKSERWVLYSGRTIRKHLSTYLDLTPQDNPLDALIPLEHLKGRRERRLPHKLFELMQHAWETEGLKTTKPTVSAVQRILGTLVADENTARKRNDLPSLITPSNATLKAFIDQLLTPSQLAIAREGTKHARNKMGRGSTDIRALFPGEYVEIDECKASLITSAKAHGQWERLTQAQRDDLIEIDEEIKGRFQILVMIDVATRMPLAWVISDQPKAEATLELLRMATRSKQYEADLYGCELRGAPPMGLGHIRNDNGSGLRNQKTVEAMVRLHATNTITRAYNSTDRPYIERMFGTLESTLLGLLHGYTGRRVGHLPGYDAQASGVINVDELYAILSRFFIDEYPRMRHYGFGMHGRRPIDVMEDAMRTRGLFAPMDPVRRRLSLGAKQLVTPSDEGVRVFGALWFNSDEFQRLRDSHNFPNKVSVFVDPDDLTTASVTYKGAKAAVDLRIQTTAFADLNLQQVLNLLQVWRKEDPKATQIHEDRLVEIRRERRAELKEIEISRKVPRSYFTIEELQRKSEAIIAGAAVVPSADRHAQDSRWTAPGHVTKIGSPSGVVFDLSGGSRSLVMQEAELSEYSQSSNELDVEVAPDITPPGKTSSLKQRKAAKTKDLHQPMGRPKAPKELK